MAQSPPPPPEPQLVGDPSRLPPRVGRAVALMAGGIAAPIASAVLAADVLHLRWRTQSLPWAIEFAATVLGLGCEVGAIVLWTRARASVQAWVAVGARGLAGLAVLLLLVIAVIDGLRLVSML